MIYNLQVRWLSWNRQNDSKDDREGISYTLLVEQYGGLCKTRDSSRTWAPLYDDERLGEWAPLSSLLCSSHISGWDGTDVGNGTNLKIPVRWSWWEFYIEKIECHPILNSTAVIVASFFKFIFNYMCMCAQASREDDTGCPWAGVTVLTIAKLFFQFLASGHLCF